MLHYLDIGTLFPIFTPAYVGKVFSSVVVKIDFYLIKTKE